MKPYLRIALAVVVSCAALVAQRSGGGGGSQPVNYNPNTPIIDKQTGVVYIPPPPPGSADDRTRLQLAPGAYVTGLLTLDGKSVDYPLEVRVTCQQKLRVTTVVNRNGRFYITPDDPTSIEATQAKVKNKSKLTPSALAGCIADIAALPGISSDPLVIPNRGSYIDQPDIGVLALHRAEGAEAITIGSATSAAAPKKAVAAYASAVKDLAEGKPDRAKQNLQNAVTIDPKYAQAWYLMGQIHEATNAPQALASYDEAIAVDPNFVMPCKAVLALLVSEKAWPDVAARAEAALQRIPHGYPEAWYDDALAGIICSRWNRQSIALFAAWPTIPRTACRSWNSCLPRSCSPGTTMPAPTRTCTRS